MRIFPAHVLLTLAWCFLAGSFTIIDLAFGAAMAYLALLVTRRSLPPSRYFVLPFQILGYLVRMLSDLVRASLRLVFDVITPRDRFHPRLVAVPLDELSDSEILIFANTISLTPGTLSIDVSPDRRWLFVHAMYAADGDEAIREITTGKEEHLLRLFGTTGRRDEP